MAEIKLLRADFRLIHGQVITKWIRQTTANKILIIDDALANDEFMSSIYMMAAPPGIEVLTHTVDEACEKWLNNGYQNAKLFVLFKDVDSIYRAYKKGFEVKDVQIGGLGAGPGRKVVYGPITMDKNDINQLKELSDNGVHVYLHQVPDDPSLEFSKVLAKNLF